MSVEILLDYPNLIRDFIIVGIVLAVSFTISFYISNKIRNKLNQEIIILEITLTTLIIIISIVILSHVYTIEAEVTKASLEEWDTENIEIVKYYKDSSGDHKINLHVNYRNISSVTATTTNGQKLDTQNFPGFSKGTLNIGDHIKEEKPNNIKIIKIYRNGDIKEKLLKVNYTTVRKT